MGIYIDAEKLGKDGWYASRTYQQDAKTMVYETKKMTDFPAADVQEVRHGKWVEYEKGMIVTSYKCSLCGDVVMDDTGYDVVKDYPYCHCGAKMDVKGRDDEGND